MTIKIDSTVTTATLVAAHNYSANLLGIKPVTKFQDRATAEKRTRQVIAMITDPAKRPQPFGPMDPTFEDDGEQPRVSATQDADRPPEPLAKKTEEVRPGLEFGEREGTNRDKLIRVFVAHRGGFVPLADLVRGVYGPQAQVEDKKGPLMMVMKGMNKMIVDRGLPVSIVKQKGKDGTAYGLIDSA